MANILENYELLLKKTRNGDLRARENLILLVYEKVKVYAKKVIYQRNLEKMP